MMKVVKNLLHNRILQSTIFGAIFTVFVALVWDIPLQRFNLEIGEIKRSSGDDLVWIFDDFDNDGNTEKARCYINSSNGRLSVLAYNQKNEVVRTVNFTKDYWGHNLAPAAVDVNFDGNKEIVFFSLIKDSIFFTAVDAAKESIVVDHLFFMSVERYSEKMELSSDFYPESLRQGTRNELLFRFDAGYGLYPRGLFKLNLETFEFTIPEKTYSPVKFPVFHDLNGDGVMEILTTTYAPSNVAFPTKYPDSHSYIYVYDLALNYLFPPITVGNEYSQVVCCPDPKNDSLFYVKILTRSNSDENGRIAVVSSGGVILTKKELPKINFEVFGSQLKVINNNAYLIINEHGFYPLTPDLKEVPGSSSEIKDKKSFVLHQIKDLDDDGYEELAGINENYFSIYSTKHNVATNVELPINYLIYVKLFDFRINGKREGHIMTSLDSYFFFTYAENSWYYFIYLIRLGLFVGFSGIIYLLLYFQQQRLESKWEMEKQLSELHFNAVKNQLNPHFMFNALNSVAYLINNGQKDEAYDFLTVNSRMIQQVMDDAKEVKRSLKNEIRFTKDYLKVQQHRFKDKFQVRFNIHPNVNLNFAVPKMCIHTYVENAVKHGFRNIAKHGLLLIEISPLPAGVFIAVTDNGMGWREASNYNDSTGYGLKTMDEFYRLFEKYHDYRIETRLVDLNSGSGKQNGLRVELKIEIKPGKS